MIHTIQLDRILQGAVATPYRDLVTRPTGAEVRSRVETSITDSHCVTALLDFSSVGLLDFSCADEVVAKLLLRAKNGEDRFVLLMGLSEEQSEAIDHVLTHHQLVIAVLPRPGETPFLLGATSSESRTAFRHIYEMGSCTAAELAREMSWGASLALSALQQLARHRLVRVDREYYRPIPLQ
jgi:hypothetical protein